MMHKKYLQLQENKEKQKEQKKELKQIIYKFFPKKIKEQIENPYYMEFFKLSKQEREKKLIKLNPIVRYIIIRYIYFFVLLKIYFDK